MSLSVTIELAGSPRGKGRGRAVSTPSGTRVFTDERTRTYESQLRFVAQQKMGDAAPTASPIYITIEARFPIARSWSKKKRLAAAMGILRPMSTPDVDNILKICDSLNGVVWIDDRQVVKATVYKIYSERPGLTIIAETVAD